MFLDISFTILWRCKLKSPQKGNLKKRIIHLSRNNNTHDLYDLYFRKGVLNTNEHSQCGGKNSININEPQDFNEYKDQLLCIEMNRLKRETSLEDVIRSKQRHNSASRSVFLISKESLCIVFPYCLDGTKNLGRVIKRHSFHEEKLVLGETNRTGANF